MKIESMENLFIEQLQDLYDAEKRLVKALPKMADEATAPELQQAFRSHLQQTQGHVSRLEVVFQQLGKEAKTKTCDAMKGLIEEGEDVISDIERSLLRDAGLIAAANRVEHYEIAAYGSARTFAQTLGLDQAASLLQATLAEEKEADAKLTSLAESMINDEALHGTTVSR